MSNQHYHQLHTNHLSVFALSTNYSIISSSSGFVWEETDTLTVLGDANITALKCINHVQY